MRRRAFIGLAGAAAITWPVATRGQQPMGKVYRLGILETAPAVQNTANLDAFRGGLRELGYVEGQNLVIDYRSADGRSERFPDLALELVRLQPDVIVTRGTPAAEAAKQATDKIPVVMAAIGEPLRIVASLARPGGNVTGLSGFNLDLASKRVELLRDLIPGLTRIAVLTNQKNPFSVREWEGVIAAARSLGVEPQLLDVRTVEEIEPALAAVPQGRVCALLVSLDTVILTNAKRIVELAAKRQLPAMYSAREFVDIGGLISYGANFSALYRRAASYVDKILHGAKPADLPVEQPTTFELVINANTARTLDLTIPQSLLARADEVIE